LKIACEAVSFFAQQNQGIPNPDFKGHDVMTNDQSVPPKESAWWVFQRVQNVNSARHVNLVRTCAVAVFYVVHLANYFSITAPNDDQKQTHVFASVIFAAWSVICVAIFLAYFSKHLPNYAKFLTTLSDLLLLTGAIAIGAGTNSWLVVGYFLIIASSAIRFDARLILMSTVVSIVCYIALVGIQDKKWFDSEHQTPLSTIAIIVTSLALAGALAFHCCHSCKSWITARQPG